MTVGTSALFCWCSSACLWGCHLQLKRTLMSGLHQESHCAMSRCGLLYCVCSFCAVCCMLSWPAVLCCAAGFMLTVVMIVASGTSADSRASHTRGGRWWVGDYSMKCCWDCESTSTSAGLKVWLHPFQQIQQASQDLWGFGCLDTAWCRVRMQGATACFACDIASHAAAATLLLWVCVSASGP